ncbi:MAG: hypothetical protein ACKVT0_09155 [Planctomycetaceae bacterium]
MFMVLRWFFAVLAVMGGFFVAGISGGIAADLVGFWAVPGAGFSAAFAVVILTYLTVPNYKFLSACVALVIGAIAAWPILEPSFFPESYGERGAYQPTHLPIIITYAGGILGLLTAVASTLPASGDKSRESPRGFVRR